jgi:hypothetical protein
MRLNIRLLFAASALIGWTGVHAAETQIDIKTEVEGKYFIVEVKGTTSQPIVVVKFVSPQGATYYTRRSMDCNARTTEYLGEGESPEDMNEPLAEKKMVKMEEGSVAEQLWAYACKKRGQAAKTSPGKASSPAKR